MPETNDVQIVALVEEQFPESVGCFRHNGRAVFGFTSPLRPGRRVLYDADSFLEVLRTLRQNPVDEVHLEHKLTSALVPASLASLSDSEPA
jgi:hypothetical protein